MTRILVTGATGYVGARLVPALLDAGHTVRVLTRSADRIADREWVDRVEVVEGDADSRRSLDEALADVDVAYYLLHSMDGKADFAERDAALAHGFGLAAQRAGVGRLVYLSGLHPEGKLSEHLASRVEVGHLLMASGVPTIVLQAAIILGSGSASFEMLRHLTHRLPVMLTPKWVHNRIQPIAISDVLDLLVARCGERTPGTTRLRLTTKDAPAAVRWLRHHELTLGDLLRDPDDRTAHVEVAALAILRGEELTFVPGEDTPLRAGDEILLAGRRRGFSLLSSALFEDSTLRYLTTGRQVPKTWLWRIVAGRREEP